MEQKNPAASTQTPPMFEKKTASHVSFILLGLSSLFSHNKYLVFQKYFLQKKKKKNREQDT